MKHVRLIGKECPIAGKLGFVPSTSLIFFNNSDNSDNYIVGITIGHELIYHHPNEVGTLEEEIQALGCAMFRGYSNLEGLKNDLSNSFRDARRPLEKCAARKRINPEILDEINQIWEDIKESAKEYPEDFGIDVENGETFTDIYDKTQICLWLSLGWARAARRYTCNRWYLNNVVENIDMECQKAAKLIEFEGQEFMLSYDIYTCHASIRELPFKY